MLIAIASRLIAFLLILEALVGMMRLANLLPLLGGYDAVALVLILSRAALGAVQFTGGWLIASRRPQGRPIGRAALLCGAFLTPFDVGLNLAPTLVYPWMRTEITIGYAVYALAGNWILRGPRNSPRSPAGT
jgi:hypothetical protein